MIPSDEDMQSSHDEPLVAEAIDHSATETSTEMVVDRRLHRMSLPFMMIARTRSYLIPAIAGTFFAARGHRQFALVLGITFLVSFLSDIFRYFTLKYRIQAGELVVSKGLISRSQRNVPLDRIQNIDLTQNFLHRFFRVAEVRIETASGTEPEATFRVLSLTEIERLRGQLKNVKNLQGIADGQPEIAQDRLILAISIPELIIRGLIGNRGLIMLAVVLGMAIEFELFEKIPMEWTEEALRRIQETGWIINLLVGTLLFAVFFGIVRVLSAIWFVLRFAGYRLTADKQDLKVVAGLITRVSATIPRKRIQFISVQESLLARMLGRASIRIETAGGAGTENEDARSTIGRRWFVPIALKSDIDRLLVELRSGLSCDDAQFDWQPLAGGTRNRLFRRAIFLSILIAVVLGFTLRVWAIPIGLIVFIAMMWHAARFARSLKYARFEDGVVYRSGVLDRKMSFTFFDKIQAIHVSQSPFDRRWKMAKLHVDTAAAGPAEHTINVPYLDEDFARREFREITRKTSNRELQIA